MSERYESFREFYPHYLAEHSQPVTRRLHAVGLVAAVAIVAAAVWNGAWLWLLAAPIVGYGASWIGHFVFERNRPATFSHPLYSLAGDFVMLRDLLTGRLPW